MAVECGGDDCADGDPTVHPGAAERCDDLDTDCNESLDYPSEDADGDGFSRCGEGADPHDCDDQDASVFPGAVEVCDGADNDCDGLVDEGSAAALGCGEGALCREGGCTTCSACAFDGSVREHWYALTVVRVPTVGADGTLAGFNLDGVVSDGSVAECAPADRTSPAGVPGIDNVLASIASALVPLGVDLNAGFAARLGAGEHLLLLQLLRVDGCTDDDVEVRVYERTPGDDEHLVLADDGTLAPGNLLVPAASS
ncbi:MAG: putative metal-binding motif-containing protein [Sandaracinaceae bacterium]|nr:putative metal-binding motif-containing protein [Sandaracinaceae bacterium]